MGVAEVEVPGRADHHDRAWWVVGVGGELVGPASFVFEPVIVLALGGEVVFAGGPDRPRNHVVEVAFGGGSVAVRGSAGQVAGSNMIR